MIKVEHLSKEYMISHHSGGRYTALRDVIAEKTKNLFQKSGAKSTERFMALNDVNFEVKQGERLGIIGRNGAGKSTLLKVLSRIVAPTKGRITIEGRVASLLEVGTGFHPELSGRENIFLNGAILGMSSAEIRQRFDEIVAFSEVEKFLDTPVKRYSSGMYVRLAFAVAAHLEPEILIVDEVLAVGDAQFQKKCLGKMEDISKGDGRTILFVSHNMASLTNLCNKGIVLEKGSVVKPVCPIHEAVGFYMQSSQELGKTELRSRTDRQGNGQMKLVGFEVSDFSGKSLDVIICGQQVQFGITYSCEDPSRMNGVAVSVAIYGYDGSLYTVLGNEYASLPFDQISREGKFICSMEKFPLTGGKYSVNISLSRGGEMLDWVQEAAVIDVEDGDFYGTGRIVPSSHRSILIENKWSSASV
jgi:lipopolysaccharide transport system ATP-binding protein